MSAVTDSRWPPNTQSSRLVFPWQPHGRVTDVDLVTSTWNLYENNGRNQKSLVNHNVGMLEWKQNVTDIFVHTFSFFQSLP